MSAPMPQSPTPGERPRRLRELAGLFLRLGATSFGGPAAHTALMEDLVVTRRGWLTRNQFLDLLSAANLIPGPNSTELAGFIGYARGGGAGSCVAGLMFILPAVIITGLLAALYQHYGAAPSVAPFFRGLQPAVIAVILGAVWRLGQPASKDWRLAALGLGVLAASTLGVSEVPALFLGGLVGMLWLAPTQPAAPAPAAGALFAAVPGGAAPAAAVAGVAVVTAGVSLWQLGWFFLKVGAVLYGSGYVLVAFLEGGLVTEHGWLTQRQLLDAVAIGQLTPGPLLSTATFIGYLLRGWPGALVATLAIFLPSFCLVLAVGPLVPRLRGSARAAAFLDAVNVSSIALMAAVALRLGRTTLEHWPAWVIAAGALLVGQRFKVAPAWLLLGGALAGAGCNFFGLGGE